MASAHPKYLGQHFHGYASTSLDAGSLPDVASATRLAAKAGARRLHWIYEISERVTATINADGIEHGDGSLNEATPELYLILVDGKVHRIYTERKEPDSALEDADWAWQPGRHVSLIAQRRSFAG